MLLDNNISHSDVVICSVWIGPPTDWQVYCQNNHKEYAKLHGYNYSASPTPTGDGIGTSSALQYIEPVLQAFILNDHYPQLRISRIISRMFFSSPNITESIVYCSRTWPSFKTYIRFCSIVAFIRHKMFWKITLTRSTWKPLLLDNCSLYVFYQENISNVELASLVLEKYLIDRKLNKNLVQSVIHSPKYLLRNFIGKILERKTYSFK